MSLYRQVEEFAADLTRTVRAVVGNGCPEFKAVHLGDTGMLGVRQAQRAGVPLKVKGKVRYLMTAEYTCTLDHEGRYLRVFESQVAFLYSPGGPRRSLLFRYEFLRPNSPDVPAAHLHIHEISSTVGDGVWSDMAAAMAMGGEATKRGRSTQRDIDKGKYPKHQDLHYPLGGERFRPCLEDFLEGVIHEFGVDKQDGWRKILADGREKWRRSQTAAVVRDSPETAVAALKKLGYQVCAPESGPKPENVERLRAF